MHTERVEKSFYGDFHLSFPFSSANLFKFSFFFSLLLVKSESNKNKISSFPLVFQFSVHHKCRIFPFKKFSSQFELFSQATPSRCILWSPNHFVVGVFGERVKSEHKYLAFLSMSRTQPKRLKLVANLRCFC